MYLKDNQKIWLATGKERVYLEPSMLNRHGIIAGATGTGKTSCVSSTISPRPGGAATSRRSAAPTSGAARSTSRSNSSGWSTTT